MNEADALNLIRNTPLLIFSTRELAALGGASLSTTSHLLRHIAEKQRITRLYRGLWADTQSPNFNVFQAVPFLTRPHSAAISLLTALHLHGMVEQIPQVIYVVSTASTKKIRTPVATYSIHQLAPEFFAGYEYPKTDSQFLLASPEKALVDSLYLSARKGSRFGNFPELHFPKNFSQRKVQQWIQKIPYLRLRHAVENRWKKLLKTIH